MTRKTWSEEFTSCIAPIAVRYLAVKRALGRKAANIEYHLHRLDRFLVSHHFGELTRESFGAWCQSLQALHPNTRRGWMRTVYHFCVFRRREDSTCFVPDPTQFPLLCPRPLPYIFSHDEIALLLETADGLSPRKGSPIYPQVSRLGVVLLYTAGLRRGEVVRPTLGDYEPVEHVLMVRETKFYKSRIVPVSADAAVEIDRYLVARRALLPYHPGAPLLAHAHSGSGHGYTGEGFGETMRKLFRKAGISTPRGCSPRVHDLRFTFAVHALLGWYRAGVDVQIRLPALATYLGHASIVSTCYYLTFCQATAEAASELYHRHCSGILPAVCGGGGQ
jgi:site-specific recombinase XerD